MATHKVHNQPPPLQGYDLAAADPVLSKALEREGAKWALDEVFDFGRAMARGEVYDWGFQANRHPPVLHTHDRFGHRVDVVEFHPAWHQLLDLAVTNGLHSLPWEAGSLPGSHLARAAKTFLASQIEAGHFCPISMTYAVLPALRHQPDLAREWEALILTRNYDPSVGPASHKKGALLGMGLTEKQGGSDVRANTTLADPADGAYRLTGHKWFTSAPMNDAFLVLAQAPRGLSCFLLPRFCPDGTVNAFHIQRLKDKLGNRSNASAEVEFEGAHARLVGEEGRGIPTIIEMVNGTRLDCVTGSAALMRQAITQAVHHCSYRRVFGARLIEQPAMANVLADLEIETEAAVLLMARLAAAFDRAGDDSMEASFLRIALPLSKYWVTKRCTEVVHEALECLGGNGYVEESIMPRLFRESPLNAIWEGSGNVIALDLLRALKQEPESVEALANEIDLGGGHPLIDAARAAALDLLGSGDDPPARSRLLAEKLATVLQASLLNRYADTEVAGAFIRSRLGGEGGRLFGTLPKGIRFEAIISPAVPAITS